ncbi:MAG TPA: hypothetical protein VH394_31555, partial [Thermoanaerobaculia bacterium]|nr:hypothetical protein [Thermoanaerobaculia bacterium]
MSIRRYVGLCLGMLLLLAAPGLAQTVSFVDANGSAVSTYLEKTRVFIRVEDPSANTYPWSAETVYVSLSAGLSGDFESLGLTETGRDTGVFEGSMALDFGTLYQSGVLETALQAGPPVVRDTLTVQYNSASDTTGMVAGRIELLDDLDRPAAGYTQDDLVRVRVEDHLRYNDPGTRESILVAVNVLAVSDEEFINLQETGNNTGLFEGSIPAALQATYDSDGVVGGPVGEQVHAQYAIGAEEWLDATVPLVGSRAEILDRAGKATELVPEAAPIRLRVVDRTVGSSSPDILSADVSSLFGGDAESVTLAETGADTGVYEAELPTAFNFINPTVVANGRLETGENPGPPHQFDTIMLSYNGPAGASSDTATTYGSETLFVDEWGNDTEVYAVGTTVFIRVIDYNYDQSGALDLIPVTLFGHTRGDYETVNLIETGNHTGVFEGSLPIQYGFYNVSTYDNWLEADPGETIEVQHTDVMGQTASADLAVIRNADIHFFDEQGRPTHEVMEGGYASIRLYNFPGNNSNYDVDTTFVMVRSLLTGDAEFVTVTETGRNTGIFEGTVHLVFSPSLTYGNGTLEVSNGGSPDYAQDTVIVSYSDIVQASATTVGARVWLLDRFGQDAESYAVGDLVGVRVEDHNVDDPQVRQTLEAVVVVNPESGDAEGVAVTETGYNTGIFEGTVPSRLYPSKIANNGTLEVQDGDRLEARHVWQHSPQLARDSALMAGSSVLFVNAQNQPVDSYLEASTAYVRLVYAGGNASSSVDVATVTVSAAISADNDVLTLTETGGDTGVFTGSIRLGTGSVSPNDGILETGRNAGSEMEMDTLTVTHTGPNSSASDTAAIEGSRTTFVNALGSPVDEYARSSRAYVKVEDQSANRPGLYDTVQVMVRSLGIGDQETIALQETTRDSGIFMGSIPLETSTYGQTYAYPGDGKLQSDAGQEIEAVHTDSMGGTSADRAQIVYASVEFFDEAGQPTAEVLEGGIARLRVFDPLSSPYSSPPTVVVRSRYANDQEYVTLTETSYGSHVFEGTIQLRSGGPGGGLQGNNILETSTSGSPEYRPDELTASYGAEAHAVTVPSRIRFIDGFGRVVSSFAVGERAGVRVEDNNLDDPLVRGTISVQVREQLGGVGDSESVTLTETGYDTNVFEGSVLLSPPPYTGPDDGKLLVSPGDVIHAEHGNVTTPAASVVEASVATSQVLFVDANGQPAAAYFEGSRAYVRVVDVFANHTPSAADSVTVMLRTTLGPDVEQLTLTETGPATGIFTGSIPLRVSTLSPGDGWLTTVQDVGTPHEFDTLRAEYNDA